jgi:hypothetical protein
MTTPVGMTKGMASTSLGSRYQTATAKVRNPI